MGPTTSINGDFSTHSSIFLPETRFLHLAPREELVNSIGRKILSMAGSVGLAPTFLYRRFLRSQKPDAEIQSPWDLSKLEEGTQFIVTTLFPGLDDNTKLHLRYDFEYLKEYLPFLYVRTVWVLAFEQKYVPLPSFINSTTRAALLQLREKTIDPAYAQEITTTLSSGELCDKQMHLASLETRNFLAFMFALGKDIDEKGFLEFSLFALQKRGFLEQAQEMTPLLVHDILPRLDNDLISLLKTTDPGNRSKRQKILEFISAYSIFLYSYGSLLHQPIPSFFLDHTRLMIQELRAAYNKETADLLSSIFASLATFSSPIQMPEIDERRAALVKESREHERMFMYLARNLIIRMDVGAQTHHDETTSLLPVH